MTEHIQIRCRKNGPLVIEGEVTIVDHHGQAFTVPPGKDKIALCRCGQSGNRPFCDGTHRETGFTAEEEAIKP